MQREGAAGHIEGVASELRVEMVRHRHVGDQSAGTVIADQPAGVIVSERVLTRIIVQRAGLGDRKIIRCWPGTPWLGLPLNCPHS